MNIEERKKLLGRLIGKRRADLAVTEYKMRKAAGKDGKLAAQDLVPGIEAGTSAYTIDKLLAVLEPLGGTLHIRWGTPAANKTRTLKIIRRRRPPRARET